MRISKPAMPQSVDDPNLVGNGCGMAAVGHFADHELLSNKRHDEPVQLTIAELAGALAGGAGIEEVLTKLTLASLALLPGVLRNRCQHPEGASGVDAEALHDNRLTPQL
jgi:hypothetical protein